MRNAILDVNVVVDLLAERKPYCDVASTVLAEAERRGVRVWVAASAIPTVAYVLEWELKRQARAAGDSDKECTAAQRTRAALARFFQDVGIVSSFGFEVSGAFAGPDIEDAMILSAAVSLGPDSGVLTRDDDFIGQDPRVMSPETFLAGVPQHKTADIPFVDLHAQQLTLLPALERRIHKILRHGNYIMGPEVAELEKTLADYVGVKHAIGCSSGTDALLLPLMALGVGPGDAVFTSPFTFIATAEVISLLGATPVFVDIDPETYNLDPKQLLTALQALRDHDPARYPLPANHRELTARGVVAVDLYGLPAEYDTLQGLCDAHGLFLVEDAAQSFGGTYKGKRTCSLGDVGATSFFPAKPFGCYGDGGMAFTNRDDLAEVMRSIRIHGKGSDKYDNVRVGLNARLDTLQAAILLAKFEAFPEEVAQRQAVARAYSEALADVKGIVPPQVPEGLTSGWAQYTLRLPDRDRAAAQKALQAQGIPTAVYYPKPLHLQSAYASLGYAAGSLPVCEAASQEVLSLPFGPYLDQEEQQKVTGSLLASLG